jgi:hypothetical protein
MGHTPDISEYAQYDWYQLVWYVDLSSDFPDEKTCLERWIGVGHDVGAPLVSWVLLVTCKVVARSSIQPLTEDELGTESVRKQIDAYDALIASKIGDQLPTKR